MMKRCVLGFLAAAWLTGCGGSAVLITQTARGGVLGLDGDRDAAMGDARRQMSDACNGAYTIVAGRNVFAGVFRGRSITEYQIRFVCGEHPDRQIAPPPTPDP